MMALTDTQIRGLKPGIKPMRHFDGKGLYLQVTPAGGKLWRFKYRFQGKEKILSIGKYPQISLADARKKHLEAKKLLADGIDPSAFKKQEKLKQSKTFGNIALEWWQSRKGNWSAGYASEIWRRLEINILPWMKDRAACEISTSELLTILRKIEDRGAMETAHRMGQVCSQIFMFAIACGYLENNPANGISIALKAVPVRNMPAITEPKQIREFLRAIEAFQGTFVVKQALHIAPLVFVRPGELRAAEWREFDFDEQLWIIPATKMKMRRAHFVPLSSQAVEILQELKPLTGKGKYVFPSIRTSSRPMSENTINAALRRLGYSKDELVAHGFRTMASTRLHEMGWKSEIIEMQLAHSDKNRIRGIYNRAQYLTERIKMMQSWADYLDSLKSDAEVIPIRKGIER